MDYVQPLGKNPGDPYIDANPGGGIEGSDVPAAAIEHAQREIVNTITAAGLVPSGADLTQLATAINSLIARGSSGMGDCRLEYTSPTVLTLSRHNGRRIVIDGIIYDIPAAGVAFTNAALAADTLYYAYVYIDGGGVMQPEISETGHAIDAVSGVETKAGDTSRSLVGMLRTNAAAQFEASAANRLVASWYNRRDVVAEIALPATTLTSIVEIDLGTARAKFLVWGDEAAVVPSLTGTFFANIAPSTGRWAAAVDSVGVGALTQDHTLTGTSSVLGVIAHQGLRTLTEGYHEVHGRGRVDGGQSVNYSAFATIRVRG